MKLQASLAPLVALTLLVGSVPVLQAFLITRHAAAQELAHKTAPAVTLLAQR